jgi:hypothetical protein
MAVKLRKPIDVPAPNGDGADSPQPIPLKPLEVHAICITKKTLIEALRIYANVADVEVVEDGERFLFVLGPAAEA